MIGDTQHERILIVDDEAQIINMLATYFQRKGYKVNACETGTEAYEKFKEKPESFSAVITDVTMPDISGLELAEKIIKINSKVPIIMMTGFSCGEIKFPDTIEAVFFKPLSVIALHKKVQEVIKNRKESSLVLQ
ncbi:MAG: response regulator [Desulfobacterales bacterium]|nr:response regulator [Desulfobacterales bacterium]